MKTLYKIQETHAKNLEQALRENRAALDASETGCGKTIVATEIAARLNKKHTIVVCPKATIPAWIKALKERGVKAEVFNYEKLKSKGFLLGRFNGRNQWTWDPNWHKDDVFIIWDEVQKCMSMKSKNGKILIGSKQYYNLMLSATAAEDPTEMRALGYVLGLHDLKDYWSWLRKNGCRPNPWGAMEFKGGAEKLRQIHESVFGKNARGSRLKVDDMQDHFMETQIVTEPVDFGDEGEIQNLYAKMEQEIEDLKTRMEDDSSNPAAKALVAQLRARQSVELLKVPFIIDATKEAIREKRSVAIFVNFNATVDALAERLDTKCFIRGGQHQDERSASMEEFQDGRSKIIICNIAAGGTGVSLHDETGLHPRTALISPSFNAKELLQVMGRVHRAGGKSKSQQRILFAAGTIEETVQVSIEKKLKNMEIFNEGVLTDTQTSNIQEPTKMTSDTPQPQSVPTDIDHQSRAHARYSPSSLTYREICPGWENDNNPNKDTTAADEGTRCHEAMEKESTEGLTEEQTLIVEMCLEYIRDLITPTTKVFKETRLSILDQFGTADWILIDGENAHVIDTKFGRRSVPDAEVNAQLQAYLMGVFDKWPQVQRATVHILLPRRDEVSRHDYTRADDYAKIKLRVSTIIARAKEADPNLFNPTTSGCQYCGRKGSCGALAGVALQKAKEATLPGGTNISAQDPEQISKFLKLIPIIESWASSIKDEALRLVLEEGVDIPGFRLCERSSARSVTSAFGAWEVLKDKMSVEDFIASVSRMSITELEKNFADTAGKGQKGKSKQALENLLRDAGVLKEEGTVKYLKQLKD